MWAKDSSTKANMTPLEREILHHFKGQYYATLKGNITPLLRRILRHFNGECYPTWKVIFCYISRGKCNSFRAILRHFKGECCATLKANITPL